MTATAGNLSGDVSADAGSIGNVTVGGDLTGTIRASFGSIGDITVTGDIDVPPTGGDAGIRCKNSLNRVIGHSFSTQTIVGTGANSGTGVLGLLKTTGGNFAGQVALISLTPPTGGGESGIIINGDFPGGATDPIINIFSGGTVSEPIKITGSFGGKIRYQGATGLTNQVIINSGNGGGTWTGSVTLNGTPGTALSGQPYYSNTSSSVGGGSVGLAPFHLHGQDCVPVNGGSHSFQSTTVVLLSHYGPVTWSGSDPVLVYWRPAGGSTWTALPTSDFQTTYNDATHRVLAVSAKTAFDYDGTFDYKLVPATGVLKCENVTGNPDVDAYEYIIHSY